jgi:hypothetical protein
MSFPDGENLLQVMLAVNELELTPLIDVEGPECRVARKFAGGPKELFCFDAELIEVTKMFGCGRGELFAAEWVCCRLRRYHGRGFAAVREVSEVDESVLAEVLGDVGFCASGSSFSETGVQGQLCAGVAEQEVLHNLLDGPLVRSRGRLELGLIGVESVEAEGYFALESVEGGVHRAGSRYTGCQRGG